MTCDKFRAVDLLAAVQTVAPKTTAGLVKTERLADEFGSPLVCDYDFASNIKPGFDPTTVIGQDIHFSIRISDGSVAGIPTPQVIGDGFAKERDVAKHDAKGDATSDTQFVFLAVDGIGDGAYFGDYITRDNGVTGADESDLSVLRATVPMTVENSDIELQRLGALRAEERPHTRPVDVGASEASLQGFDTGERRYRSVVNVRSG